MKWAIRVALFSFMALAFVRASVRSSGYAPDDAMRYPIDMKRASDCGCEAANSISFSSLASRAAAGCREHEVRFAICDQRFAIGGRKDGVFR